MFLNRQEGMQSSAQVQKNTTLPCDPKASRNPKLPFQILSHISSFLVHFRDTISSSLNEPPTYTDLCLCFLHWECPCLTVAHLTPALKNSAKCYLPLKGFPHHPKEREFFIIPSWLFLLPWIAVLSPFLGRKLTEVKILACYFIIIIIVTATTESSTMLSALSHLTTLKFSFTKEQTTAWNNFS